MGSVEPKPRSGCGRFSLPEGAASALLLAPAFDDADAEACADHLTRHEPERTNLLAVTLGGTADERLDVWRSRVPGRLPARVGVVTAGDGTRSAAAGPDPATAPGAVSVSRVADPADLTGLGIRIGEFLSAWDGDDNGTVVCFESATTLLQFVELRRAFRFLHLLEKRVASAGGSIHVHMDPGAHDERTVATIRSLFDAVFVREDGAWTRA